MLTKHQRADGQVDVTFRMTLDGVTRLSLLGDFNHWNAAAHPLTQAADGTWSVTVSLPNGEYQYRYFANGSEWLNDPQADGYAPNQHGTENSLARVEYAVAEAPAPEPAPKKKRAPAKPKAVKAEGEAASAAKKRAPRKKSAA